MIISLQNYDDFKSVARRLCASNDVYSFTNPQNATIVWGLYNHGADIVTAMIFQVANAETLEADFPGHIVLADMLSAA